MSAVDSHVTLANHHLSLANRRGPVTGRRDPDDNIEATIALAQATLALVEEQRTANLIAALSAGFHLGHDFEDTAWADEIMPRLGLRGESR